MPRANRGSRLQELIKCSQEGRALPEDEFWADLGSDSEDNEYNSDSEEDEVDSDFDDKEEVVDEAVAALNAEAQAQEVKKTTKKKNTYFDPAKQPTPTKGAGKSSTGAGKSSTGKGKGKQSAPRSPPGTPTLRKSTRRLSIAKAEERAKQKKIADKKKKGRAKKQKPELPQLTQEQLLEEAKITEQINKASLEVLLQMEEDNKKLRRRKKPLLTGDRVKYHSSVKGNFYTFTTLPSFLEPKEVPIEGDESAMDTTSVNEPAGDVMEMC